MVDTFVSVGGIVRDENTCVRVVREDEIDLTLTSILWERLRMGRASSRKMSIKNISFMVCVVLFKYYAVGFW